MKEEHEEDPIEEEDIKPTEDPEEGEEPEEKKRKKKKGKAWWFVTLAAVAAVAFVVGWFGHYYSLGEEVHTFLWGLQVSERNYYKPLDEEKLYQDLYDVLDLDPYSELFTPVKYDDYVSEGKGRNSGVGISLQDTKVGTQTIPRLALVAEGSPASVAGLRKGMYVFGFGVGEELQTGNSSALRELIGDVPDPVNIRCGYEQDGSDAQVFTVQRGSYQTAYVHYRDSETSFRIVYKKTGGFKNNAELVETNEPIAGLDGKTAYIRLDEFSGNAADEFEAILSLMHERGRENLILDLRTDGGGYMDILCDIASHLMRNAEKSHPVVAKAVFRSGREQNYNADGNDFYDYFTENSKVYILADENTASASECLIGAMVDYGTVDFSHIYLRQNASGTARSYGKGIMQSTFQNPNGAAMKLTTAEIVWPNGKSIHGVGVTPNDGAIPVAADLIWGNSDPMLEKVIEDMK